MVLFGRIGNGTWTPETQLTHFQIAFPDDNDDDVLVRTNDEDLYWTQARAAQNFPEGATLTPTDVITTAVPGSATPTRFINGVLENGQWKLDVRLDRADPRRIEFLAAGTEFAETAFDALKRGNLRAFHENAFHAAELLATAELLTYSFTATEIVDAKSHGVIRSTYQLWAHLENTDARFAKLLHRSRQRPDLSLPTTAAPRIEPSRTRPSEQRCSPTCSRGFATLSETKDRGPSSSSRSAPSTPASSSAATTSPSARRSDQVDLKCTRTSVGCRTFAPSCQ